MSLQGNLSIERMCRLAQVSRAGFYRSLQEQQPLQEEMAVRSTMQQIVLEHRRRYGYRRVTAELRRQGLLVNHKRVARLMREDNLLAVQPRAFVLTTDSQHELQVYLNLASRMQLTGINQLWVADISVPQQAVWKMEVGPPESAYRSRFQTTISGGEQKSLS
jgi:putative transposase